MNNKRMATTTINFIELNDPLNKFSLGFDELGQKDACTHIPSGSYQHFKALNLVKI